MWGNGITLSNRILSMPVAEDPLSYAEPAAFPVRTPLGAGSRRR